MAKVKQQTQIKIVPVLMPVLDSYCEFTAEDVDTGTVVTLGNSHYGQGWGNLGPSIECAGVRTRTLVITDVHAEGFVRTFNRGIRKLLGGYQFDEPEGVEYVWDYVCLMVADLRHESQDWLKKLVTVAESDKTIGFVGVSLRCGTSPQKHSRPGMEREHEVVQKLVWDGGIIRKAVFEEMGLQNPAYRQYGADYEYTSLALLAGWKAVYVHEIWAEHAWEAYRHKQWKQPDRDLYYSRWTKEGVKRGDW